MYPCFTRVLIFIMFISRLKHMKGLLSPQHMIVGAQRKCLGGHCHRVSSYHITSNYQSAYCAQYDICNRRRLYSRPLCSSPTPSNENNDHNSSSSLDLYLSQLRGTSLTVDEAQSIKNALSNLDSSTDDDKHTKIINDSINIYRTMNKKRLSSSGQGIENPGLYVRSIVRNQLMKLEDIESTEKNIDDYPTLQPIMSSNNINIQELNDNCLTALSQCPNLSMVDDALKAYTRQQKRREMNGTDKISNPSSYIMAVLRNIMAESSTSPSPTIKPPQNDDSAVRVNEVVIKPAAITTNKEKVNTSSSIKPRASSSEVIQPIQQEIPNLPQSNQIISDTDNIQAIKDKPTISTEKVTMEYVDECISCLEKLDQPIIQLKGVGAKTEAVYHKLGIFTLRDLLWHFPRSFIDRSTFYKSIHDVPDGEVGSFILSVEDEKARSNGVTCIDESNNVVDVGQQGMFMVSSALKQFSVDLIIVSGKVKHTGSKSAELFNPDLVLPIEQINKLGVEAVYALSSGLTQKKVLAAVDEALGIADELLNLLPESLSENTREKLGWPKFVDALRIAHKPSSLSDTGVKSPARLRIAFEEMQTKQAKLALERWKIKHYGLTPEVQNSIEICDSWRDSPLVSSAISALPFTLSSSQEDALGDLWEDIKSEGRMYRLLNGDVGSGKTVLSYLIGLGSIEACQGGGRVVSLLCPTQLLANQHVRTISDFADRMREKSNVNIQVELLTGNVIGKQRDELFERLKAAKDDDAIFLIGTHALTMSVVERLSQLQGNKGLALAIIDEEQRFGVKQRDSMQRCAANLLSMSATPIPRSLSLQDSGIMDTTLLDSEPRTVETTIVSLDNMDKVLSVLKDKVKLGSKCFWVVPRVKGTEDDGSVLNRFKTLVEILGEDKCCHVYGEMSPTDREEQLEVFTNLESGVLVGTTVIEVGIDVPNANILVVEEADRFGLSQLHQLRGRIGRQGSRSDLQCNCLLLSNATSTQKDSSSLTRLQILTKSNQGREIADADLILRGPGEMLGISQAGIQSGYTVDQDAHWHLLKAATASGRGFMDDQSTNRREEEPSENNTMQHFTPPFYDQTSSSSKKGFALRMMMTLFGDRSREIDSGIDTIQNLDISKRGELSQEDQAIHDRIIDFYDKMSDMQFVKPIKKKTPATTEESFTQDEPMLPIKPHLTGFNPTNALPLKNRLNLLDDDVMFVVLDVETTGLDDKTSHVIQLAGKVLGSDDDNDLFSEYILPPIDCIPKKIEELTGITDQFLRHGGYDKTLDKEVGTAREFKQVYRDFQDFCKDKAQGRKVIFVAHNAKFDMKMINGELRRWRFSDDSDSAPILGNTFASSLDTLHLFREKKFWSKSLPRPSSFSLGTLHEHVLSGESISNSHNAVGDILALERLLQCETFQGWQSLATRIQAPILTIKVDK